MERQREDLAEESLVKKAMLGDAPSMEKLIARYYDAVYAFCCRRIGDVTLGADVCQNAFLKMIQHLPGYRERGYFKSWLFRIASNCCNDAFRKKRISGGMNGDIEDDRNLERDTENALLIKEALDMLPDEQKEVVILRYYHDFSTREVARVQRVPAATVKTRLYRGLRKLRKILGKEILLET